MADLRKVSRRGDEVASAVWLLPGDIPVTVKLSAKQYDAGDFGQPQPDAVFVRAARHLAFTSEDGFLGPNDCCEMPEYDAKGQPTGETFLVVGVGDCPCGDFEQAKWRAGNRAKGEPDRVKTFEIKYTGHRQIIKDYNKAAPEQTPVADVAPAVSLYREPTASTGITAR
jgi:hypothetical protein